MSFEGNDRVRGKRSLEEIWASAEGLLFDFDGVLADSEPLFRLSWNMALEPWGHSIPEEEYWLHWSSLGEGLKGEISRNGLTGIDSKRVRADQNRFFRQFCLDGTVPLFPATARLLNGLIDAEKHGGPPFCIASNTPSQLVRAVLENGDAPVPRIVGGEDLPKKPEPDIFLAAAAILGSVPASTPVFEDSWKGATAASRGGFPCVVVLNRLNAYLDIPAELKINGLEEILAVLDE